MSTALLALVTRLFQSMMSPRHKRRRLAAGPTLLDLPNDCIYEVLLRVRCPRSLAAGELRCPARRLVASNASCRFGGLASRTRPLGAGEKTGVLFFGSPHF